MWHRLECGAAELRKNNPGWPRCTIQGRLPNFVSGHIIVDHHASVINPGPVRAACNRRTLSSIQPPKRQETLAPPYTARTRPHVTSQRTSPPGEHAGREHSFRANACYRFIMWRHGAAPRVDLGPEFPSPFNSSVLNSLVAGHREGATGQQARQSELIMSYAAATTGPSGHQKCMAARSAANTYLDQLRQLAVAGLDPLPAGAATAGKNDPGCGWHAAVQLDCAQVVWQRQPPPTAIPVSRQLRVSTPEAGAGHTCVCMRSPCLLVTMQRREASMRVERSCLPALVLAAAAHTAASMQARTYASMGATERNGADLVLSVC